MRVDRYSQWHGQRRQAGRRWGGRQEAGGLVVQLRGRPGGSGQPVDRRVGEQQVAVDRVLGELVGLGPLLELSTIQASCPAGESVKAQARAGHRGRHPGLAGGPRRLRAVPLMLAAPRRRGWRV